MAKKSKAADKQDAKPTKPIVLGAPSVRIAGETAKPQPSKAKKKKK